MAYNFKDILLRMDSFRHRNYEQALMETFLKLDELLKNEKVNQFLYDINFSGETKYENYQSSQSIKSANRNRTLSKDNYNIVTIKYKKNYINIDLNETTSGMEEDYCDIKVAKEMGTTANVVLLTKNHIYISNVGDSLSVMFKNGKAVKLNQEHKTTLRSEYERIQKSGGHIYNNRIEGKLKLTRAIGDLIFKSQPGLKFYEQSVTAFPEITKIKRTDDISFIVMACDGVWDCVEEQGFCEEIEKNIRMNPKKKLSDIIAEIFDKLVSKTNNIPIGTDNMSCIIVQFVNSNDKYINNSNEIKRSVVED